MDKNETLRLLREGLDAAEFYVENGYFPDGPMITERFSSLIDQVSGTQKEAHRLLDSLVRTCTVGESGEPGWDTMDPRQWGAMVDCLKKIKELV